VVLGLLLAACAAEQRDGGKRGPPPPVPVRVAQAVRKTVPLRLQALGTVVPIQVVSIRPRVAGQLVAVEFREGEAVRAGDVLFRIDPRPFEVALAQEEARVRRDKAQLAYARTQTGRTRALVDRAMVARDELDQSRANVAALEATIAVGEAAVAAARLNLEYATLASPIDGRTGNLLVTLGNVVAAGGERPLVVINQLRPIHVSFAVPERELPGIQARQAEGALLVEALPRGGTAARRGELAFVDHAVDPGTGTILLKAVFPNDDEALWPGQFVDVSVTLGERRDVVVVPSVAVQTGQEGRTVFVVREDQTVEVRPVRVSLADERETVVDEGLSGGETVVVDGQLRLRPGSRVKVAGEARGAGGRGAEAGAADAGRAAADAADGGEAAPVVAERAAANADRVAAEAGPAPEAGPEDATGDVASEAATVR
jgi:multidrug efflux system membrane fusion protein